MPIPLTVRGLEASRLQPALYSPAFKAWLRQGDTEAATVKPAVPPWGSEYRVSYVTECWPDTV